MSFSIKPFAEHLAALEALPPRKTRSKKKPKAFTRQESPKHGCVEAWARDDLGEWPSKGPIESLYLFTDLSFSGIVALDDPKAFLEWANFGNAVGTWNVEDPDGMWKAEPGTWLMVLAELARGEDELGESTDVAFAIWRVTEGYAVAIMPLDDASDRLPVISGIAWPEEWISARLWYGE